MKLPLVLIVTIFVLNISGTLFAQEFKIKGAVKDRNSHESIPGVVILIDSSSNGTISEKDGTFEIQGISDKTYLRFSHISYKSFTLEVNRKSGEEIDVGTIELEPVSILLEGVNIISSYITDRHTPVAITTLQARTIEQKIGNQDFPEVLKMTPGIYSTKEGGGSGDDRLTLRGFQQENVSLLLNGVPVSSMENGLVYWSNWAGLTDATEAIQVQRGLGASRVAMNSVGGTINIITKSVSAQAGGSLRYSISEYGNRKTILSYSSGKLKNGISLTFLGSRTYGQGFVDATYVNGWAYFLSVSREFGKKHRLVLTAMGAPEKHGQRNYGMSQADFVKFGVKYNSNWGTYKGELVSLSENFYHKPQINLNHYWTISPKLFLASSAYISFGNGGGHYTEAFNYGKTTWEFRKDNQIDFDQIYQMNAANTDSYQLANGEMVSGYSKNILTNYMATHYWAGILSTLTIDLSKNLKITTGFHYRYFRSHLYEEISDLMGGDFWIEQYAWSKAGVAGRNQIKKTGDIINVDNYSIISYGNVFGQAEYKKGKFTAFAAGTISGTSYQRKDPYNYIENPLSDAAAKSGFDVKMGAARKLGKSGNFYANIGYYSREPYYKFVFVDFSNAVAKNLVNEKISSAELGYTFENEKVIARLNLYYTQWKDKSLLSRENIQLADSSLTRALIRGLNALHKGIEAEIGDKATSYLNFSATLSLGDWKWQNDVSARIYNDNQVLMDSTKVFSKGLYVGDAPQTQLGLSAEYHSENGFRISADWVFYDRLYADFDPVNRSNQDDRSQPYRIPSYSLLDLYAGYEFKIKHFPVSLQLACQNVFNKVTIIRGDDGAQHNLETFSGFWSLGRTFNLSAKISF